jgi:hypothetical protein
MLGFAGLAGGVLLTGASVQGQRRVDIKPYLEIQQVLSADLNGGDVLTYSTVGAGVDASISTRRVQATISYNYQRRVGWGDNLNDEDVHTGLAAARLAVIPNVLNFDAGAMAIRSHADPRSPISQFRNADEANAVEVYSAYAGPTLSTHVGPLDVGASYRIGYVAVDDNDFDAVTGPSSTPRIDRFDSSTVQSAAVSVGMKQRGLPVGWTVGAGWEREDAERLDSKFEGKYVRADMVVPVSANLAVTAGAGYEKFKSSQQDIVRDSNGVPVVTPGGDLIADPSKPRLLAYDQSGLIWDAGVIWRPSPNTELQARVGRRYGGTTVTGSFQHKINENASINASVYDSVDSFGHMLITDLAGVPRRFDTGRKNRGMVGIGHCVSGIDPGTGACFDDALQAINNFTFRNRGANLSYSASRGVWSYGFGLGYDQRRYYAPPAGNVFVLDGVTDRSYSLSANAGRRLTRSSGYNLDAYATLFDSGIAGSGTGSSLGLSGTYYRNLFNDHLQANVSAGIYNTQGEDVDSTVASLLFGLRYNF